MISKHIIKPVKNWVKKKINNVNIEIETGKIKKKIRDSSKFIYFSYKYGVNSFVIPKEYEKLDFCTLNLPIPPKNLWLGYGKNNEEYLSGKLQIDNMLEILDNSGFILKENCKILDFGCGAGRMIRWLKPFSEHSEIWGTDISSEHIYWANKYLKPPFNFAVNTTIPHLPFRDSYFNLIYAGSVFTHIDDLTDTWLLELKRILSEEGLLYLTIHDKHSLDLLTSSPIYKDSLLSKYINEDPVYKEYKDNFDIYSCQRSTDPQVFYDIDYFCKSVSNNYSVVSVTPEAYGYQTGVLLKPKFSKKLV